MKVLLIANCVFFGGGTQTYIRQVTRELQKVGHEVFYLSTNKKDQPFTTSRHYSLSRFDSPIQRFISQCFINIPFIFTAL